MSLTTGCPYFKMCDCEKHGWIVVNGYPSIPLFSQPIAFGIIDLFVEKKELLPEEEQHLREEIKAALPVISDCDLEMWAIFQTKIKAPKTDLELADFYFCPFKDEAFCSL